MFVRKDSKEVGAVQTCGCEVAQGKLEKTGDNDIVSTIAFVVVYKSTILSKVSKRFHCWCNVKEFTLLYRVELLGLYSEHSSLPAFAIR